MNKLLTACTLAAIATLAACDNKGPVETTVIERETIREVPAEAPTVVEVEKNEATGDSLSISIGSEGSSIDVRASDK